MGRVAARRLLHEDKPITTGNGAGQKAFYHCYIPLRACKQGLVAHGLVGRGTIRGFARPRAKALQRLRVDVHHLPVRQGECAGRVGRDQSVVVRGHEQGHPLPV